MDNFEFKKIIHEAKNSDEAREEVKEVIANLRKGWNVFEPGDAIELTKIILSNRMSGVSSTQLAIMGILIINEILRLTPVTEDEMMEIIRAFKAPESQRK